MPADVPTTGPNTHRGEKPPVMPLEATQHTATGATAFAEFFIKTIDWGFAVVSGRYLTHYSSPNCVSCSEFSTALDRARARHNEYIGGRIAVRGARLTAKPTVRGAAYTAMVRFDVTAFEALSPSGKVLSADGAHDGEQFEVSIAWSRGWRVTHLAADR